MPVSFNSPPRNFFLLGSGGEDAVTNFFHNINKSSLSDGQYSVSDIAYTEVDQQFLLSGSGKDANTTSFGWLEKRNYNPSGPSASNWSAGTIKFQSSVPGANTTLNFMKQTLSYSGDIIVGGKTNGIPWIAQYSGSGLQQWISTSYSGDVEYTSVACKSSNYYACGYSNPIGQDEAAFIEKFDSSGNPTWGKTSTRIGGDVRLNSIAANDRGEVVAVGEIDGQQSVGYVVKVDTATGDILWDLTIDSGEVFSSGLRNPVNLTSVYIDGNDQIYIVGQELTTEGGIHSDGVIFKYTAEGNLIWHKKSPAGEQHIYSEIWSDTEVEQTIILSHETVAGSPTKKGPTLIKYSKNGDVVFKRRIQSSTNTSQVKYGLDGDPSFYYILFVDEDDNVGTGASKTYNFGKVSASGNGFGAFTYDATNSKTISYNINSSTDRIGRLSDGSVRNDSSDNMSYPYSGLKTLFDDYATNIAYKKTRHAEKDVFLYSGSPSIRPSDFQELNLLGVVYSGSGDWLDQSGKGNDAITLFTTNAEEPFSGAGSVEFDGSGDYLSLASSSDLTFGTGDFTVEMLVYANNFTNRGTFYDSRPSGGTTGITIGHESSTGEIRVYMNATSGSDIIAQSTDFATGTWYHVAVTCESTSVRLFVNGVLKDTGTGRDLSNTNAVNIGYKSYTSSGYNYFNGFISNFRVLKGTALYTANFTPPTSALTNTGQTAGTPTYSDYFYGTFTRAAVNAFDGSLSTRAEPSDDKTIYVDFSHVNPTGTLLNFNGNSKLPTYLRQDNATSGDGTRSNPIYQAFDGSTSTFCDMTYLNGQYSRLIFDNPITNVTNITIGYDGEGDPGYNGGNHQTSISFNGSRQTVQLYNGSAITLTDLDFITQPGNGMCYLYDVTITVGGTATLLTLDGGVTVNSSLRTYMAKAGNPSANHYTVNARLFGGSVTSGWLTINAVSKLKQIALYHDSGSSSVELFAVEVDGSILVDGSGGNTGTTLLTAQGGSITDASDSNLSITVNGDAAASVSSTNGPTYNAAGYWEFGGVDDYIQVPTINSTIEKTYSIWATLPASGEQQVFSIGNSSSTCIGLTFNSTRDGNSQVVASSSNYGSVVTTGSYGVSSGITTGWHNFTITTNSSGNITALYIDAVSYPSRTEQSRVYIAETTTRIGDRSDGNFTYSGSVGDILFYPRALTAAQVFQNYNATKTKYINEAPDTAPRITSDNIVIDTNLLLNYDFGNRSTYDSAENLIAESILDPTSGLTSPAYWTSQEFQTPTRVKSPFGSNDAYQYLANAGNVRSRLLSAGTGSAVQLDSVVGEQYVFSIFVKAINYDIVNWGSSASPWGTAGTGNTRIEFNLSTGTAQADLSGTSVSSASMIDYGDGWWRLVVVTNAATDAVGYRLYLDLGGIAMGSDTHTTSEGFQVYGAQVEVGTTLGRHIKTYGSAITAPTTVKNLSSSSIPGTINGSTFDSDGYFEFDGTDDSITVDAVLTQGTELSMESWFNANTLTSTQYIVDQSVPDGANSGAMIRVLSNGQKLSSFFYYDAGFGLSVESTAISSNTWHHVVVTISASGNALRMYIDGALEDENTSATFSTIRTPPAGSTFAIGSEYDLSGEFFDGEIGEVRIYQTALSATEVLQNFNATRGKYGV